MQRRITSLRLSWLFGLLICASSMAGTPEATPTLRLAVAANFAPSLRQLAQLFYQQTGVKSDITVGASGSLFAQIVHGAPYDVFFSADAKRPEALIAEGVVVSSDVHIYVVGQLALVGSHSMALSAWLDMNPNASVAIADPVLAPYGTAAKQVLESMGQWRQRSAQLVRGSNIQQTLRFWQTGNVDAAIIAASQCEHYQLDCWLIDPAMHLPIVQKLAVIQRSRQLQLARDFVAFIVSQDVTRWLEERGYLAVGQRGEQR